MRRGLALALAAAILMMAAAKLAWTIAEVDQELGRARDLHGQGHATSGACQRCHPGQFASWSDTFHRTMTQEASEEAVLGDFDDARFDYGGVTAVMSRSPAGGFQMRLEGVAGELARFEVVRTVGSHWIQQYLARDGDVFVRLPMAWHVGEGRWFHMNGAFLTPDPPAVTAGRTVAAADYNRHVVRWNDNCVFCHNVAANPGMRGGHFETEVAELGIACEACHGPAQEHARINADPVRRYTLHLGEDRDDPTIVNPRRLEPARRVEVCGRCHGQRITDDVGAFLSHGDPFVPGDTLSDYSTPLTRNTTLRGEGGAFEARFWSDGTARLTAYEVQGLLQSPCDGLTCTDCHGMHEGAPEGQMRPSRDGDAQCTTCHADDGHDGHRGTACVDCHMPHIVYGIVSAHRSHRIEVPRPEPALERPDACSLCHADRSPGWVAAGYAQLFGGSVEGPPEDGSGPPRTRAMAVAGDPVARAVALAALGRTDGLRSEAARAARVGLVLDAMDADPYPALRRIAWRSLRRLSPEASDDWLGYIPTSSGSARREFTAAVRSRLGAGAVPPDPAWILSARARAGQQSIFIGE